MKILIFGLVRGFNLVLSLGLTTPLITPVMGISWPCILEEGCADMLKMIVFGDLVRLFSSLRPSVRTTLVKLCEIQLWGFFRCNLRDDQLRVTRASCLLALLLALESESPSLLVGIHMWGQAIITTSFLLWSFCLISACWSGHYLTWGWVPSRPVLPLVLCT